MSVELNAEGFGQRIDRFLRELNRYLLGEMQKIGLELQADITSQMQFTQPSGGSFRQGSRLGVETGDLSRSLIPGKPGNIFKVAGSLVKGYDVEYGIDPDVIHYALIHETGGFIRHRGKMPAYLFHLAKQTGLDKYRIIAIAAKRDGGLHVKKRPFFEPGTQQYKRDTWPKKLDRIETAIERIWIETA